MALTIINGYHFLNAHSRGSYYRNLNTIILRMNTRTKWLSICLMAANVLFTCQILAQDCSQILQHGIYDTSSGISDTERAASFVAWFKENTFSSYSEAKNYAGQVGIPIDDVLVTLGFSADEKGYSEFKQSLSWYQQQDTWYKQKLEHYVSTINQGVVQAWEHCITSSGLHFWIVQESDPTVFLLCARYISDGGDKPKLEDIQFEPANAVSITSGPFFKKPLFSSSMHVRKRRFDGNLVSQAFHRTNSGVLTIVVNSSRGNGLQTDLPDAYPKPDPYIIDFSITPNVVVAGQAAKLLWNVKGAETILIDQGLGAVTNAGSLEISPQQSTSYKITAENDAGSVSKEATLTVNPPPSISSFTATFQITGDKKKQDGFDISILDANQKVLATGSIGPDPGNENNFWPAGQVHDVPVNPVTPPAYRSQFIGSHMVVRESGAGDEWHTQVKVTAHFSDGSNPVVLPLSGIVEFNHNSSQDFNLTF